MELSPSQVPVIKHQSQPAPSTFSLAQENCLELDAYLDSTPSRRLSKNSLEKALVHLDEILKRGAGGGQ